MRYVEARVEKYKRDETYRIFVSESLRLAPQGKFITKSWHDIFDAPVDTRSGDEIAQDVILNAGLSFGDDYGNDSV